MSKKQLFWIVSLVLIIFAVQLAYSARPMSLFGMGINYEKKICTNYDSYLGGLPSNWEIYYDDLHVASRFSNVSQVGDDFIFQTKAGNCTLKRNFTDYGNKQEFQDCCEQLGYTFVPDYKDKTHIFFQSFIEALPWLLIALLVTSIIVLLVAWVYARKNKIPNKILLSVIISHIISCIIGILFMTLLPGAYLLAFPLAIILEAFFIHLLNKNLIPLKKSFMLSFLMNLALFIAFIIFFILAVRFMPLY